MPGTRRSTATRSRCTSTVCAASSARTRSGRCAASATCCRAKSRPVPVAPSLRRRLLWLLLLALALAWGGAAVFAYFDAHRAVDTLLDAHMRQSARLLVAQAQLDLDELRLDEDDDHGTAVAFQV